MLGTALLPFLALAAYLEASRRSGSGSAWSDNLALAGAVAIGIAVLSTAPINRRSKVIASGIVAVALLVGLFVFGFGYVCSRFQSCL